MTQDKGKEKEITIRTQWIKLDALLKFCGEAGTGGQAKMMIEQGEILHNGETCTQRGRKIRPGDVVEVENRRYRVIGNDH